MNKTALPYNDPNGKRVMFRGCENFGIGSFDPVSRMHLFSLTGNNIIPCRFTSCAKDIISTRFNDAKTYNGMVITVFEN